MSIRSIKEVNTSLNNMYGCTVASDLNTEEYDYQWGVGVNTALEDTMNSHQEIGQPSPGKIGITAGVFDLLHLGHLVMLEYCKKYCDHLIVAVQVDPSQYREGKNKPIESVYERIVRLGSCKYVDSVLVYESEEDLETILKVTDYDIRFIGQDHQGQSFTADKVRPETFHFNPREHDYSSENLRKRIIKGERLSNKRKRKEEPDNVPEDIDETRVDGYIRKKTRQERKSKD